MKMFQPAPNSTEAAGARLLDAAFEVHRNLGLGLLESVYEVCVCHELTKFGVSFQRQTCLPIVLDDVLIESGLNLMLLLRARLLESSRLSKQFCQFTKLTC